ncbi:DUF1453 domain-containing protein [Streptomyces sp. NPDC017638]|uniref:DUF1453 domain-containing protein n=1 Tax=Streptomyces sp. NPDC017638 TaxID=3365004 RepID=UPI0037A11334
MSGLVNALAIVAVVAVMIVRQSRARAIDTDRRWWLLPVVLTVVALREPGIVEAHDRAESAALLAVELIIGLATGVGWGWTTRLWTAPDGTVWTKGTKASIAVWVVGIALRAGVLALCTALGLHQDGSAFLLGLAVTLLARGGILAWRAQSFGPASRLAPAYGGDNPSAWKERV